MELFRALGALAEPPSPGHAPIARSLELPEPAPPSRYADLFLFQLYPYASVYLDPSGLLGGEARDRIAGFWRALDLDPPEEPDHLTVLLAFQARAVELHHEADAPAAREAWRRARKALLWEHLLSWLPIWLGRLSELAEPFYAAWGRLLAQALEAEARDAGAPEGDALPLHLRAAPSLDDPDPPGETGSPLGALLAPARSGIILVRSDLRRAADELGLGLRSGERVYALRALLEQDRTSALGWLAAEARRQSALVDEWPEAFRPVAGFWRDRASRTAARLEEAISC